MKFGVKTFDSPEFLKHFEKNTDFFEIMALQKVNHSFLKDFSLPMIIHAEHMGLGSNPADRSKKSFNLKSINYAIKLADLVNSNKIILHPGVIENRNCSSENAVSFINSIKDERIILENLPLKDEKKISLCATPEETEDFLKQTGRQFCFDANHAILSAFSINEEFGVVINKFLQLKPIHFHIGGQKLKKPFKDHLSFKESDLNLAEIFKHYPKSAEITLETETDVESVEFDLGYVRKFSL